MFQKCNATAGCQSSVTGGIRPYAPGQAQPDERLLSQNARASSSALNFAAAAASSSALAFAAAAAAALACSIAARRASFSASAAGVGSAAVGAWFASRRIQNSAVQRESGSCRARAERVCGRAVAERGSAVSSNCSSDSKLKEGRRGRESSRPADRSAPPARVQRRREPQQKKRQKKRAGPFEPGGWLR
eukprot:COSAG06_NODE_3714_length_4984_cov_4.544115_3_plen_189_part_00